MMLKSFFISILFFSLTGHSEILLKDIGVIGLMSHDIFAWDHKSEKNTENGRLDLSTIFDYEEGKRWKKGGNPKNSENPPVWSITKRLVNFFKSELKKNNDNKNGPCCTTREPLESSFG